MNTAGTSATTRVTVKCVWEWKAEGEGAGEGRKPPDLYGSATGIAKARPAGTYWNVADAHIVPVGVEIDVNAYTNANKLALSTWTVSGPATNIGPSVGESITIKGTSPSAEEYDVEVSSTCNECGKSDTEHLTIVGVVSIEAEPAVICVNGEVDYKITTQPKGFEHMVSWTPADTSTPGIHEVIATCGTSSATTTVTVVKVELEQTDSNEPLDPINRMCSNAQEAYKTVKYQIGITPTKDHNDNDLTVVATVGGTAGVTFDDGTSEKTGLSDGSIVTLRTPDDATGTWSLTAECEQVGCSSNEVSEEVFKFVKKEQNYDQYTYRPAPGKPNDSDDYAWQDKVDFPFTYTIDGPPNYVPYARNNNNCNNESVSFVNHCDYNYSYNNGADFGVFLNATSGLETSPSNPCRYTGMVKTQISLSTQGQAWQQYGTAWYIFNVYVGGEFKVGISCSAPDPGWNKNAECEATLSCGEDCVEIKVETHGCVQRDYDDPSHTSGVVASQEIDFSNFNIE